MNAFTLMHGIQQQHRACYQMAVQIPLFITTKPANPAKNALPFCQIAILASMAPVFLYYPEMIL